MPAGLIHDQDEVLVVFSFLLQNRQECVHRAGSDHVRDHDRGRVGGGRRSPR